MVNARFLPVWTDRVSTGYFLPSHSRSQKPTESYKRLRRHMASVDHINRILGRENSVATESRQRQSRQYPRFSDSDRRFSRFRRHRVAMNNSEPDLFMQAFGDLPKHTPVELEAMRVRDEQILKEGQDRNAAATVIQRAWRASRRRK
jgi:hypothetical protein